MHFFGPASNFCLTRWESIHWDNVSLITFSLLTHFPNASSSRALSELATLSRFYYMALVPLICLCCPLSASVIRCYNFLHSYTPRESFGHRRSYRLSPSREMFLKLRKNHSCQVRNISRNYSSLGPRYHVLDPQTDKSIAARQNLKIPKPHFAFR